MCTVCICECTWRGLGSVRGADAVRGQQGSDAEDCGIY